MSVTKLERFVAKVVFTEKCWLWNGAKTQGYGSFNARSYQTTTAYRWMYEHLRGPVPKGMQLDHLCRNRICVNPAHLEAVTQKTNWVRGDSPTAKNARKTHCLHGHEFTAANTYQRKDTLGRKCRACMKITREKRKL